MPVNKKILKIIEETEQLSRMLFGDKMFDFYLYGSYARGDYNKYSDIDLLITLDLTDNQIIKYREPILDMTNKLIKKYDIMISIVMVPVDRFLRFSKILPFYRNVIKEGINYGKRR
jgi:predicted nucleotidyltransferase